MIIKTRKKGLLAHARLWINPLRLAIQRIRFREKEMVVTRVWDKENGELLFNAYCLMRILVMEDVNGLKMNGSLSRSKSYT